MRMTAGLLLASMALTAPSAALADAGQGLLPDGSTVVRLDRGEGIDVDRSIHVTGVGTGWMVYERADERFTRSELRAVHFQSDDNGTLVYSQPTMLLADAEASLRFSPSLVTTGDDATWLYYAESAAFREPGELRRARFEDGHLGPPSVVTLPSPISPWTCPQVAGSPSGTLALIHRTRGGTTVAFSDDGQAFTHARQLSDRTGSTPAIAAFPDGRWVAAFQHGPMGDMESYFRISDVPVDGEPPAEWTAPRLVNARIDNIHNSTPVRRGDGGLDFYYLAVPPDWRGFSIYRRCLRGDASLGPPELVLPSELGNLLEPLATRISPTQVLVTFNEQRSGHHLHAAVVSGDAACEEAGEEAAPVSQAQW